MTVWDGIFQEVRTQKEQRGHEIPNMWQRKVNISRNGTKAEQDYWVQ